MRHRRPRIAPGAMQSGLVRGRAARRRRHAGHSGETTTAQAVTGAQDARRSSDQALSTTSRRGPRVQIFFRHGLLDFDKVDLAPGETCQ